MDQGDFKQLKRFIRGNLKIETEYESTTGNNIVVSLKLKGDKNAFAYATIFVPEDDE